MKEVKVITINGTSHFVRTSFDNIDETIESMYKRGYEYKGSIVSEEAGYGNITQIKLIFDKEM